MMRRSSLWLFSVLLFAAWRGFVPAFAAPDKPISIEIYRAQLEKADSQLRRIQARAPRLLAPILNPLTGDKLVKRKDGQTQNAGGDEFARALKEIPGSATREQVQRLRESIAFRKVALDAWKESTYAPADAQEIIAQLEGSGQIRTGPTWLEQAMSNFRKWAAQSWKNFLAWVASWFPKPKGGNLPSVDPLWIRAIFTLTVLALLATIGFLIWRAVGGKIGRKARPVAFAFSPEDAELLLLPPDELRERARKLAAEGNFREALRHLYVALLLNFDARGVWRYDARRTNWEHIAALKSDGAKGFLVAPLSDITRRFDHVRYGNAACEKEDWTKFERDVTALEGSTSL